MQRVNEKIKVSIMIPTYNQELFIQRAIESALSQDYEDLEVVVCDDCSTDNTWSIIDKLQHPKLKKYRNSHNLGRVKNYRHILYDLVGGDWVINLDGDDYFFAIDFIKSAIDLIVKNKDIVLVSGNCQTYINNIPGEIKGVPKSDIIDGVTILKKISNSKYRLKHMTSLYSRKIALNLQFYSKDILSSDVDGLYKLISFGKVGYIENIVGVWNIHGSNASQVASSCSLLENLDAWISVYHFAYSRNAINYFQYKLNLARVLRLVSYGNLSNLIMQKEYRQMKDYLLGLSKVNFGGFLFVFFDFRLIIKIIKNRYV